MEKSVAKLSGYLSGIASVSGKMGEFSAFAFLMERKSNVKSLDSHLVDFFQPRTQFSSNKITKENLKSMELEIRNHLLVNALDGKLDSAMRSDINDRKKLLSFRIVDAVDNLNRDGKKMEISKITGAFNPGDSQVTFFCITLDTKVVVLQFQHKQL